MNLIDKTFAALKLEGRSALMPFLTMGDPDLDTSVELIQQMEAAGADLIELGVPYSDPLADGPVIQRASQRALEHHVTIDDCIEVASKARASGVKIPLVLFTYYNPVLQSGQEKFFGKLKENGISGIIIPDLPHEENELVTQLAGQHDIHLIPLVAPTSKERIEKIVSKATGFVYCVSSLGVTGVRSDFDEGVEDFLNMVKSATSLPIAIGFGISTPEHVSRFSQICDGIVVGSAIVRNVEDNLQLLRSEDSAEKQSGLNNVRQFVSSLNEGTYAKSI